MSETVVILGAGHGGVQAAASLREEEFDGEIILVSDENDLPYHKPPLSKAFMKDAEPHAQLLRGESFYSGHSIELKLGGLVDAIDGRDRRLSFADGSTLAFDRLVIATGSRPRMMLFPGSTLPGVLTLRTIADARAIREAAASAEEVVVIGGGFIGLEIAATLSGKGCKVTVVEAQERLLGRVVAEHLSAHARLRLEDAGIHVLTRTTIDRLEGDGRVAAAVTSSGTRLPAQLVVIGIGVVPNVELAAAAGLAVNNGVAVDGHMRSSDPAIFAIGDCASYRHWQTDQHVRLESVQNATDQARLAARAITGKGVDYSAVPWFWSDIGDMKLQMVGLATGSDRQIVAGNPGDNKFSIYRYAGDRLMAIESVNRPADHMLGRRMIAAGFSPTPETADAGADALKAAFTEWQKNAEATVV